MLQGFGAIALWSTLASLTALAGPVPPFLLAALTFGIGAVAGVVGVAVTGRRLGDIMAAPAGAIALGVAGLLGYHALYFFALQNAPAIEANVLNYLWPLLIVLFSALLPAALGGKQLSVWHVAGALVAFAGALLAVTGRASGTWHFTLSAGHVAGLGAAVTWAAYSVGSRLYADVPSSSVVLASALTAVGAALLHLAFETTRWPEGGAAWTAVVVMGIGPVGVAFILWDTAVKRADLRLVGVMSYSTPLMSNGLLALLALGEAGPSLWGAVVLVAGGALIAARDQLRGGS